MTKSGSHRGRKRLGGAQRNLAPESPLSRDLADRPAAQHGSGEKPGRGLIVALLPLILLLPFANRAFSIDDPLYIWAAKNIQAHPADPYGFLVNWYGTDMPMSEVTKNPPLASYYMALAASLFGWSELALHLAFLLPAFAVGAGAYRLARRFCANPTLAALAGLLTPVFFVSSVTVMCDVIMLAFWVWAVYFWMKGLESDNHLALGLAALLIPLAALTKYFGMALIPLLLLYSIIKRRRVGWWAVHFIIPIAVLAWYQWTTQHLYGRGLLLDAAEYARERQVLSIPKMYVDFAFAGGCVASVLFFARHLWSRAALLFALWFAVVVAFVISSLNALGSSPLPTAEGARWLLAGQLAAWGPAGVSLMVLAGLDLHRNRNAESLFLFLWLIGTFVFAGFVNWSTNGRSILPMAVPAGILIVRRLEQRFPRSNLLPTAAVPLVLAGALSLAVTWADSKFADTGRVAPSKVLEKYPLSGRKVWFQGHWGFQYYMEQLGAKALNVTEATEIVPGDIVVVPATNTNTHEMTEEWAVVREVIEVPSGRWLATMGNGAGFYADVFGPLPFAFGSIPPERFTIVGVRPDSQKP